MYYIELCVLEIVFMEYDEWFGFVVVEINMMEEFKDKDWVNMGLIVLVDWE